MDGVIKDLGKIQSTGTQVFKKLVYYGYIPLILYLGARTIDWCALPEGLICAQWYVWYVGMSQTVK